MGAGSYLLWELPSCPNELHLSCVSCGLPSPSLGLPLTRIGLRLLACGRIALKGV